MINLIGKKFGPLKIIERSTKKSKTGSVMWQCVCECGNIKAITGYDLTSGRVKSCGCQRHKKTNMKAHNKVDLLGQKFGKLTVIGESAKTNREARWLCLCECGKEKSILSSTLKNGNTRSCGCLRNIPYRWNGHEEMNGTYWNMIKSRRKNKTFSITKEQIWEKFLSQDRKCAISGVPLTFAKSYNKNRKDQTASLDRIDSSIGYILNNVQWVHKDVNIMKNALPQEKFIKWCEIIYKNNK